MFKDYIREIVSLALTEDVGEGDITTNYLVPKTVRSQANIVAKSPGVVCGMAFARQAFAQLDPNVRVNVLVKEGRPVKAGTVIARLKGSTQALLTGERVALNFLSYCSGIATKTKLLVDAVKPYKVQILDTRKTTPLLRELERYGVRCGGGTNHRFDLSKMVLVKDNHLVFAQDMALTEVVAMFKSKTNKKIELEVDTLVQLQEALQTKVDVILLDNMTPAQVKKAVAMRNKAKAKVKFEASGGINLKNIRQYAAAGVERISIGSLTLSRQAVDMSLEFCS